MFSFLYKERRWGIRFPGKKNLQSERLFPAKNAACKLSVTFEMGPLQSPLHETVTWYKNHLVGWQKAQWDLEKKGYELFEWGYIFVFVAPLRRFPFSKVLFLYHVTVSCKEFIGYKESGRENVTIQLACQISYSLCSMSVHIFFQGSIPFAVIGSNTITDVRGKQVRVRQYPWGMAEGLLI